MADDADKTAEKQEIYDRYLLSGKHRRPELPPATGLCFFCNEPLFVIRRFCDQDCESFYNREQARCLKK